MGFQRTYTHLPLPHRGTVKSYDSLELQLQHELFECHGLFGTEWIEYLVYENNKASTYAQEANVILNAAIHINAIVTRDTRHSSAMFWPHLFSEVDSPDGQSILHNVYQGYGLNAILSSVESQSLDSHMHANGTEFSIVEAGIIHIIEFGNQMSISHTLHFSVWNQIVRRLLNSKVVAQIDLESNSDDRYFKWLAEASPVDVYLDDERQTPKGWLRVTTPDELNFLMAQSVNIQRISFDHDLGFTEDNTGRTIEMRGIDCLSRMEEIVYNNPRYFPFGLPEMTIHSANPVGRKNMAMAIENIGNIYHGRHRQE